MQTHLQCFHKEELSVTCDAKCFGSDQRCAGSSLRTVAVLSVVVYGGFVPLMYFFLLLESRRAIQSQRPTALSNALTFLYAEYRPGLFFWELVLSFEKILLTGILALVQPGSLTQLFTALIFALCFQVLQLWVAPHVDLSNTFLASVSSSCLVLLYIATLAVQTTSEDATAQASEVFIGLLLVGAALLLLICITWQFVTRNVAALRQPVVHWSSDGSIAMPRELQSGSYHLFVSHVWRTGQDQARVMKQMLQQVAPGVRVFLDLDDLDSIEQLEMHVRSSQALVAFLSASRKADGSLASDYFTSANCLREIRCAAESKLPIVFCLETDSRHGAAPLPVHLEACPPDLVHLLENAIASKATVPWVRVTQFQHATLRSMLTAVMPPRSTDRDDKLYMPSDVQHQRLYLPRLSPIDAPSVAGGERSHLYVCAANEGASDVAASLASYAASAPGPSAQGQQLLRVATGQGLWRDAGHILVYLNATTFDNRESRCEALIAELEAVLRQGQTKLVLCHEQRESHGACTFDSLIKQTPQRLINHGLYNSGCVLDDSNPADCPCCKTMGNLALAHHGPHTRVCSLHAYHAVMISHAFALLHVPVYSLATPLYDLDTEHGQISLRLMLRQIEQATDTDQRAGARSRSRSLLATLCCLRPPESELPLSAAPHWSKRFLTKDNGLSGSLKQSMKRLLAKAPSAWWRTHDAVDAAAIEPAANAAQSLSIRRQGTGSSRSSARSNRRFESMRSESLDADVDDHCKTGPTSLTAAGMLIAPGGPNSKKV